MNHLAKVEPHAAALEAIADRMGSDGLGGHNTNGHAAILRRMAGQMLADAVLGKLPDTFYAAADKSGDKIPIERVNAALDAIGASSAKRIEFKSALAAAKLL